MSLYRPYTVALEKARLLFKRRNRDAMSAVLGDSDLPGARVDILDMEGFVYARFPNVPDANGFVTYGAPMAVRSSNAAYPNYPGAEVYIAYNYSGELEIVGTNNRALDQAGIDTRAFNPLNQQSKFVYLWQITIAFCSAVANSVNNSYLITVKKFRHYVNNTFTTFETGTQAEKESLSSVNPATDMHRYAAAWLDTYRNELEVTTSTTQSLFTPLNSTDVQEVVNERPPDAIPLRAFYLANNQDSITQQPASDVDLRQFLNMPQIHGLPNPIAYRERIQPGRQAVYHGTLTVTATLTVLGSVTVLGDETGDSGSGTNTSGWQDDGTVVRLVTTTDNVNIGGTTDLAKLAVVGDTDEHTVLLRPVAGQSAANALLRMEDSSATEMIRFQMNGATRFNLHHSVNGFVSIEGSNSLYLLYADPVNNALVIGGSLAEPSSVFDINSTTRGILIPRMTTTQRNAISSPATGLLIFNTTTGFFEFYTGSTWTSLTTGVAGANVALSNLSGVAINTTLVSDTDNTDDLGSSSVKWREAFTYLLTLEERTAPSTPSSGDASLYAKVAGTGQLFFVNDSGVHKQVSPSIAHLIDSKTSGTNGGTSNNTTWNTRDLNTEQYDPDGIVTISSNKFTPIAGTYILRVYSPILGNATTNTTARNRLFNVTAATTVIEGDNVTCGLTGGVVVVLEYVFTANGSDEYRIDTYTNNGRATNGLGAALTLGTAETYTRVVLEKIG